MESVLFVYLYNVNVCEHWWQIQNKKQLPEYLRLKFLELLIKLFFFSERVKEINNSYHLEKITWVQTFKTGYFWKQHYDWYYDSSGNHWYASLKKYEISFT